MRNKQSKNRESRTLNSFMKILLKKSKKIINQNKKKNKRCSLLSRKKNLNRNRSQLTWSQ